MSAVTRRGEPTAATSTSASRQTAARSRVREWQWVTVALAASSSCASGLPTRIERPTPRPRGALELGARLAQQLHDPGGGAGGHRLRPRLHQQAGVGRGQAVDVLGRVDQRDQRVLVQVPGQRELEQDAVHARVGVQRADQLREVVLRARRRRARGGTTRCPPRRSPPASCARRPRRRGRRRRGSWRGPAGSGSASTSTRTCSRTRAATAFPSITRGAHRFLSGA